MAFGELDWPQCSWGTGFVADKNEWCATENPLPTDPVDSIYLRLRARNLCNHRDYQDHSWNGARSSNQLNHLTAMARTKEDNPLLVLYSMFANDVCNDRMDYTKCTTPTQFDANIRTALGHINGTAPAGTNVVLIGHEQGELMWDTLARVSHPILGSMSYGTIWQFIASIGISPCAGWLNNDAGIRAGHTDWAESLDAAAANVAATASYPNLDVYYLRNPLDRIFNAYNGPNRKSDLFTYLDGGHWQTELETLFGRQIWSDLMAQMPQVLGPVNPNNAAITARFGGQGGH
jgi:acyloxyacyl hydrolase